MPVSLIKDCLQTQGLNLPIDAVRLDYLAVQAVINMGEALIEPPLLWYDDGTTALSEHIEPNTRNENLLKQIFMALDSVFSRQAGVRSAVVYALMPAENLLRLAQQGEVIEQKLALSEDNAQLYLPVRTAQTGWLNMAADTAQWLEQGGLAGEHNRRSGSQMSLPVCSESGAVLGVVHVEYAQAQALDEAAQAVWVALSLALAVPMQALLQAEEKEEANDE